MKRGNVNQDVTVKSNFHQHQKHEVDRNSMYGWKSREVVLGSSPDLHKGHLMEAITWTNDVMNCGILIFLLKCSFTAIRNGKPGAYQGHGTQGTPWTGYHTIACTYNTNILGIQPIILQHIAVGLIEETKGTQRKSLKHGENSQIVPLTSEVESKHLSIIKVNH